MCYCEIQFKTFCLLVILERWCWNLKFHNYNPFQTWILLIETETKHILLIFNVYVLYIVYYNLTALTEKTISVFIYCLSVVNFKQKKRLECSAKTIFFDHPRGANRCSWIEQGSDGYEVDVLKQSHLMISSARVVYDLCRNYRYCHV